MSFSYEGGVAGNVTFVVAPKSKAVNTLLWGNTSITPFPGTDADTLFMVHIEDAPAESQGKLMRRTDGRRVGTSWCRNRSWHTWCKSTWTYVRTGTVNLYQTGVTFTPSALTFTTSNYTTAQSVSVQLSAKPTTTVSAASIDSTLASTPASLTFTDTNYTTAQTINLKLKAKPAANVTINLSQDNVTFSPASLTFTTVNWNTAQSVSVKLASEPRVIVKMTRDNLEATPETLTFTASNWDTAQTASVTFKMVVTNPVRTSAYFPKTFYFSPTDSFTGSSFTFRTIVQADLLDSSTRQLPSALSTATLSLLPALNPTTPTNFVVSLTDDGRVKFEWTALSTDTANATANDRATIRYSQKTGNNAWSRWYNAVLGDKDSTSFTFSHARSRGLQPGETYYYRLRSTNKIYTSPASNTATLHVPAKPLAPSGFTATGKTGQVDVSWTASTDTSISKYQYRQLDKGGPLVGSASDKAIELQWDRPDTGGKPIHRWQYRTATKGSNTLGAIAGHNETTRGWSDPTVPQGKTVASWQYRWKVDTCPVCGWTTWDIPGGAELRSHVAHHHNGTRWGFHVRPKYIDGTFGSWSNKATATNSSSAGGWVDLWRYNDQNQRVDIGSQDGELLRSYTVTTHKSGNTHSALANGTAYFVQVRALSPPLGMPANSPCPGRRSPTPRR